MIKLVQNEVYVLVGLWLNNTLRDLKKNYDRCTVDLLSHSRSCPSTMSLSDIDTKLQDFARLHHLDLSRRVNYLIARFKDEIREKELATTLFSSALRTAQVNIIRLLSRKDVIISFFIERIDSDFKRFT